MLLYLSYLKSLKETFTTNYLAVSIRESQSLPTFRHHLKTFHFQSAYPLQLPTLPRISSSARPDSSKTLALYNSFTYLLTYLLTACAIYKFSRVVEDHGVCPS